MLIDLRSDTVTKPGPEMLEYMFQAEVGDDVFGADPSVNRLQDLAAKMFSAEAALFCPSGTMTNQIGIFLGSGPLTEVITEEDSHVYQYEVGGIAFHSGANVKTLKGERGKLHASQIETAINPIDDHKATTALISLENTTNRGGGACYGLSEIQEINKVAKRNNLHLHLDGARIFNALVETEDSPASYGELFDSISICLSKGLGAPVGSLLLGSKETITKARRVRKVMGGGMRQAGFLAAAGTYALENNVERLKQDHMHAKQIHNFLGELPYIESCMDAETNILIFELAASIDVESFLNYLKEKSVLAVPFGGQQIRFVTHLDFKQEMLNPLFETLKAYK